MSEEALDEVTLTDIPLQQLPPRPSPNELLRQRVQQSAAAPKKRQSQLVTAVLAMLATWLSGFSIGLSVAGRPSAAATVGSSIAVLVLVVAVLPVLLSYRRYR